MENIKREKRIGKRIGNNLYIHRSAFDTLTDEEVNLVLDKKKYISQDFRYEIIRINLKEQLVAFIQSEDWDIASEPMVGDSWSVDCNNKVKLKRACGQIYHHKWLFVKNDYEGFDVEESKKWSERWLNSEIVQNLKSDKNEKFNCKIGYKNYFDKIKVLIKKII